MKNLGTPASCCCALATLGFLRHIGSVPKRWMTEEELESCESCSVDCYPNDLQCWIKSTGILPIYKCWRQFIQGATVPINVFASCDHVKQHGMKSSSRVSKADDECSTAIQPSFWYEKEPRKNPDIFAAHLCYTKKKTSNDSTWSALYRNSPKRWFFVCMGKSHMGMMSLCPPTSWSKHEFLQALRLAVTQSSKVLLRFGPV